MHPQDILINFYLVDDGSGTIACCWWESAEKDRGELCNLGQLVTVQGTITVFREQRQLTVDKICIQTHWHSERCVADANLHDWLGSGRDQGSQYGVVHLMTL